MCIRCCCSFRREETIVSGSCFVKKYVDKTEASPRNDILPEPHSDTFHYRWKKEGSSRDKQLRYASDAM